MKNDVHNRVMRRNIGSAEFTAKSGVIFGSAHFINFKRGLMLVVYGGRRHLVSSQKRCHSAMYIFSME